MNNIKKTFEKLVRKYKNKRAFFQKVVSKWGKKGWKDVHAKGVQLLEDADHFVQELTQDIIVDSEGQIDRAVLDRKLGEFKDIYKELYESTKPVWQQWLEAIVIALVLAIVLRHTVFSPYHVPTGSAEPNISVGDRIWGNKMAYYFDNVKRGDLVIFDDPRHIYDDSIAQYLWQRYVGFGLPLLGLKTGPINVVKRVVAVPGDTIEGKIEERKTVLYLNGKKLDEPYVNTYPLISLKKSAGFFDFEGIGPIGIPLFLRKMTKQLKYTYDPSVPYEKQPFYTMNEQEIIIHPRSNKPILEYPRDPIYLMRFGNKEFFSPDTFGPLTLPEGMYWVMGDSRRNSEDCRFWGPLNGKFIRGRASFILFSIDSEEAFWFFDLLKHPIDFWTKHIRWNRFFKGLKNGSNFLKDYKHEQK